MPTPCSRRSLLWRPWLIRLLACLLAVLASAPQAADLIRSREMFEDTSGQLELQQVLAQPFVRIGDTLSRGYTRSAFWIRITVSPGDDGAPTRLRIVPTVLDDIRLYEPDPNASRGWKVHRSGDVQAFTQGDRTVQSLGFVIHPAAPLTTYYLRIETTGSTIANIEALSAGDSRQKDANLALFQIFYLVFMALVLAWAVKSYAQQQDRVTAFFIGHQFLSLLLSFAVMGYLAPLEPHGHAGLANTLTSVIIFCNGVFGALFHREIFALFVPNRILMAALYQLAAVFAACGVAYLAGWRHQALHANAMTLFAFGVVILGLALTAKPRGPLSLRILRFTYTLLSLSLLAAILPSLGWVGGDRRVLMGILIYGFLSAGMMVYLLSQRARRMAAEANEKLRQGELAIRQLELEKQYANEQERFIDMLTHELKTPISVALMSIGALKSDNPYLARIRRALGNINNIVDHTRLAELARRKRLPMQLTATNASERVYECIEASTAPDRVKACVGFGLEVLTDSQLFGVIVANLIDNALKYSPPDAAVELTLQPHYEHDRAGVRLRIVNPVGPAGHPDPARVFTKYYRSPGAQNKTGSGLGLNLSMSLATLLGARLSYQARDHEVEFELWLPA